MSDVNDTAAGSTDTVADAFDNLVRTMKQAAFDGDDSVFGRVGAFVPFVGALKRDWQAGAGVASVQMPKAPKAPGTPGRRGRRSNAEIAAANAAAAAGEPVSSEVEGAEIDASGATEAQEAEAADMQAAGADVTGRKSGRRNA